MKPIFFKFIWVLQCVCGDRVDKIGKNVRIQGSDMRLEIVSQYTSTQIYAAEIFFLFNMLIILPKNDRMKAVLSECSFLHSIL